MRQTLSQFFIATFACVALLACKPQYPSCKKDAHCGEKGEVCVDQQCQECRDDQACISKYGPKHECVNAKCEPYDCRADSDCGDALVCRSKRCVPECTESTDCPSGKKCDAARCVNECVADADCPEGYQCDDNGACRTPGGDALTGDCAPTEPGQKLSLPTIPFDFNSYDLTDAAQTALDTAAGCMRQVDNVSIVVEGHCDERGTQEYNLALGEQRAAAVRNYMRNLGIDGARFTVRSMGENRPICTQASESCWDRNRRVEFIER